MKKTVLVGGCFDVLHWGHISFLKKAKKMGNYLVVALESDENVKCLKGSTRPIHNQKQRAEILRSLRPVDKVIILPSLPDYLKLIRKVKPQIIAATPKDALLKNRRVYEKLGAKIVIIPKIKTASTTQIAKLLKIE
jgi:rfaE bifunctional protein nucleotidyltransferase chain/domain